MFRNTAMFAYLSVCKKYMNWRTENDLLQSPVVYLSKLINQQKGPTAIPYTENIREWSQADQKCPRYFRKNTAGIALGFVKSSYFSDRIHLSVQLIHVVFLHRLKKVKDLI